MPGLDEGSSDGTLVGALGGDVVDLDRRAPLHHPGGHPLAPGDGGHAARQSEQRGVAVASPLAPVVIATVHPSSLLRMPDPAMRRKELARFVADLRALRERAGGS